MHSRTVIIAFVLVAACAQSRTPAAPAYATGPTPDEFSEYELPDSCVPMLARVNARGAERLPAWIELAGCLASSAIALAELDDSEDSVALIDEMTAPSLVLLDHVIGKAPVETRIAALHAKADLYGQMSDHLLATVEKPADSSPDAWRAYEMRRQNIEALTAPWQDRALALHRRIVALGEAHPELATNPEVKLAIRDSERQLAAPIATRE